MATLEARHLHKAYRKKVAVDDVSLAVSSGEIVGLLGPNGAGKTTCFYMIVGLLQAEGGEVALDGRSLTKAPMHVRARAGIGYLPQEASVFRKLSTEDNLRAILELRRDLGKAEQKERVEQLLAEFRLGGVRKSLSERLSGGERRRLEIARALASEPRFMLLDEPFAGVDPISVADIKNEIRDLAARDIGILITDHNVRDTLDICDRAYIVNEGHLIAEGDAEAILGHETVRDVYLGESFRL
ncbi:MAG: LPS export ABC transporter ATP-binding protein [Gammaproteobacteria bacterium]|nr:LPS export ABC transporter ATP-binding protein [Gammaproteobacteria bacterium]MYE51019.1 LPS export ABC transporter ATP-binding protein [Gammaproteobacteria bacterium]MYE85666.1 LPS export ABC transporter ATP-binding protein [Gammaproteobacteria bacterium]MYE85668.1 LPS export ABC transporter ATP-binding protein [Gammaproteobacteria bacterium]